MRRKIVGASWKMHVDSIEQGVRLTRSIKELVGHIREIEMFILPPFPMIFDVSGALKNCTIKWGSQNIAHKEKGALTGEVPPRILKEIGCTYVEIGHAERRRYFNETDEMVNKKVKLSIKYDMIPVICIGETLADKDDTVTVARLKTQVLWALHGLTEDELEKVILAYEPVWAIGQSISADPQYVSHIHTIIRGFIKREYGPKAAREIRIIYGGSVDPGSAKSLSRFDDIDGVFVGRSGLVAENFKDIVNGLSS